MPMQCYGDKPTREEKTKKKKRIAGALNHRGGCPSKCNDIPKTFDFFHLYIQKHTKNILFIYYLDVFSINPSF